MRKRKATNRKPSATSTALKLGSDVPRHPGAARTKRREAMVAYRKAHPAAMSL